MLFWVIITMISVCLAGFFASTISLSAPKVEDEDKELGFYMSQLDEVKRDLARRLIFEDEADRVSNEIARRILALNKRSSSVEFDKRKRAWFFSGALVIATVLTGGGLALYNQLGEPGYGNFSQLDRIKLAEERRLSRPTLKEYLAQNSQKQNNPTSQTDVELLENLRHAVSERPDDLQGSILLARIEAGLLNFLAASEAQKNVLRIKDDTATIADHFAYAEMLILAGSGYVSPEAESALNKILAQDPKHIPSLYYIGLLMLQIDRPDRCYLIWQGILRQSTAGGAWLRPIRKQMKEVADAAGIKDYKLPELTPITQSGPTQADVEAASEMSEQERLSMIEGMVESLAARLNQEGGTPDDWIRLIRALKILGRDEQAQAIFVEATTVFEGKKEGSVQIRDAGKYLGLNE